MKAITAQDSVIDLENKTVTTKRLQACIIDENWVSSNCGEYLSNYFGTCIDFYDLQANATLHIISPQVWKQKPSIGDCFYGLIEHRDLATPSDVIRGDHLVYAPGAVVCAGDFLHVTGDVWKHHKKYWLSHPVVRIIN